MRVNKCISIGVVLMMLNPISSLFFFLSSISSKSKNRTPFFCISFLYFLILIKLPPYGDSYRRLMDYDAYVLGSSVLSYIGNHPDFLFYLTVIFFKNLNIPYFFIPALYGSGMIYLILASLRNGFNITKTQFVGVRSLFSYIIILSSFDIISYSLGLRFGLGVALVTYGITTYFNTYRLKGIIALALSITVHFSMIYIVLCFFLSFLLKINKKMVIPLSIMSFILSSTILPYVLNHLHFINIAKYAMDGYVQSAWANSSSNNHTFGVFVIRNALQLIIFFYYIKSTHKKDYFDNFIYLLIPFCFLMSISFSAVQRYLVVANLLLLTRVIPIYSILFFRKKLILIFFLIYTVISGFFLNIYIQRVAIIWGGLYSQLYTPPITLIYYSSHEFQKYLGEVKKDGNWVKNTQK